MSVLLQLKSQIFAAAAEAGITELLVALLLVFVLAKLFAEVFERLRWPAIVGEILAGIVIGPSVLNWVSPDNRTLELLAELGVIFLLFTIGLQTKPSEMIRVGKLATRVAMAGVFLPFVFGYGLIHLEGGRFIEGLFMGTAMVATSVGITSYVLARQGVLHWRASRVILGAAVIDDIIGLIALATVSGTAQGGVHVIAIVTSAGMAIAFTVFMATLGARGIIRISPHIEQLRIGQSYYVVGIVLCLLLSVAAAKIGIAAITGAFLAGMAFAELSRDTGMVERSEALTEFLVPFFLVYVGMQVRLEALFHPEVLATALLVTFLAILGKLIGCGGAALSEGRLTALRIGVGMVPRGEVGIIVAQIGLRAGAFDDRLFAVVIFMSAVTTLITPPFLRILFRPTGPEDEAVSEQIPEEMDRGVEDLG